MSNTAQVLIIAEAGVNHNGNLGLALQLVDAAIDAKADIVKFQIFDSRMLATNQAAKADYQKASGDQNDNQQAMLKTLELSHEDFIKISQYCNERGIEFLATAFDEPSLDFLLSELCVKRLKIPSGELTNLPFILRHARSGLPLILSTGMASEKEIEEALATVAFAIIHPDREPVSRDELTAALHSIQPDQLMSRVTILQCTTAYPTSDEDVNLRVIPALSRRFQCPVGFSDHTADIFAAPLAVAAGASIVEKHFTLSRTLPGPDHQASLEPAELKRLIDAIRRTETILGSSHKAATAAEERNMTAARKSLVAALPIKAGQMLTAHNITAKRPGNGLSPACYWETINTTARRDYEQDELI
ncbi:MAG: N-acetylneuraminate synthase [Oceanospirillaceae bacterium]|nr:N-acetylneuraminate synthase [Oceanospirillaceae bacterium]|tara:strand:+ start:530 stop:1609 length:1080 start_codon:yes stop_codon:yes gene_type:complete